MKVLFWGTGIFLFSFLTQLIWWRVALPKRQVAALLKLFFGILTGILLAIYFLKGHPDVPSNLIPGQVSELLHIFVFVGTLALAYIGFYTALEVDSPSVLITLLIAEAGPDGLERTKLDQKLNDDYLVLPRVRDLIRDHMAREEKGKLVMTSKGVRLITLLAFHRGLMGMKRKGG